MAGLGARRGDGGAVVSARVLRGDVRTYAGQDWVVIRTERGGRGEARTMVVIGQEDRDGVLREREARTLATVASWPKKGRVRVSFRPSGGYYYAPWIGARPVRDGVAAAVET